MYMYINICIYTENSLLKVKKERQQKLRKTVGPFPTTEHFAGRCEN